MKKFNLREYIGDNPLLKELHPDQKKFWDEMNTDDEGHTSIDLFKKFKEEDILDDRREYDVEDLMSSYPGLSKEEAKKLFGMLQNIDENKPIKEDGQWDDKWSPSFDDLKNRAKQIKGFEDMGKYGFAIPYEHGEIEIEPQSNSEDVKITWISPGNEDSQVSPLSIGYKAVDQAIRSSQDKADWKRMAGLEEIETSIKEYSWDDEEEEGATQSVNDIYSEYTSQDGWDEDALEDVGLMELISEVERLAYEVRNARRGSYAKFGDTGEELKTYLEELGRSFTQISNNM